jgi:hypothetical protein
VSAFDAFKNIYVVKINRIDSRYLKYTGSHIEEWSADYIKLVSRNVKEEICAIV